MASREICDVKHPCIKDADSLWIFSYKDRKFIKINRSEYPKTKGTICQLCPNGLRRTNDSVISCGTKVETWSTLKGHLVTVERIFGELVAFPDTMREDELPDVSNYGNKYRAYGQLIDYQEKDEIYVFDVAKNKFIMAQRNMLSKMYTKFGCCNYCPCPRKVQSPSSILQHIQSIENRFFCYLVVDNESQNDQRNQEKIQLFVNSIKSNRQSADGGRLFNESEDERSQSSEYLSLNGENERMAGEQMNEEEYDEPEDAVKVLAQMEQTFNRDCKKLGAFFGKLKSKVNISSLDQSIINSQEQLIITKREENAATKEKNLAFTRKLDLDDEDLVYLMKKYEVPHDYRIKNVDVNLHLNLKLRADRSPENTYNDGEEDENAEDFDDEMQDETSRQSVATLDYDEDSQQTRSSLNSWPAFSLIKQEHNEDN